MSTISKDIIVLIPNGRRQKVHCSPDTTILQVLEDACAKHGIEASQYDLKHHNHILDLTTTVRFSNLPNKATLELVELERQRQETNVTVGLLLEDGDRRTADFPPKTSLFELIVSLAPAEIKTLANPCIMFMRQEVTGVSALQQKTLRQLGLLGGRAILRLLNKQDEPRQANVSAVYRAQDKSVKEESLPHDEAPQPGPSNTHTKEFKPIDPLNLIKEVKKEMTEEFKVDTVSEETPMQIDKPSPKDHKPGPKDHKPSTKDTKPTALMSEETLQRRLKIEEEVTFVGDHKAIVFRQPDNKMDDQVNDLPDDFYDLSVEEVHKLYQDLQNQREELENSPLLTTDQRKAIEQQRSEQILSGYKNVVVRVQFPDTFIIQGIFVPSNTIGDVRNFVKQNLATPNRPFHIFTTPFKEPLDPKKTLLHLKFVPCVHMHFKWADTDSSHSSGTYLKKELYSKETQSDAASLLASKYRAPSRQGSNESPSSQRYSASTSQSSKAPKWFKR